MTCIVAVTDGTSVHMAGDLMGSDGFTKKVYKKSKVFIKDDFIIGYTSSFRMGQLLEYSWLPPLRSTDQTDDEYIYQNVVDSFIQLFKDNDYGCKKDCELETGEFLFGYKGRLFYHQGNHSLLENHSFAIGAGCYHAEGALQILTHYGSLGSYERMLGMCIGVASQFVMDVSEDYTYLVLEG